MQSEIVYEEIFWMSKLNAWTIYHWQSGEWLD